MELGPAPESASCQASGCSPSVPVLRRAASQYSMVKLLVELGLGTPSRNLADNQLAYLVIIIIIIMVKLVCWFCTLWCLHLAP